MIDIHCHLLPGVDDGPRDARAAIALASRFVEEGVTAVVATPHRLNALFPNSTAERTRLAAEVLRDALESAGVALRVEIGAEVVLQAGVVDAVLRDSTLTMRTGDEAGRYVLLEIPAHGLAFEAVLADAVFRFRTEGLTPILAHVERYSEFGDDPSLLEDLRERGALTQVTGAALAGRYGSEDQKAARLFLKRGLVDILASDAHDAVRRPPCWSETMREAERIVGKERAAALSRDHPERVLLGTPWPF